MKGKGRRGGIGMGPAPLGGSCERRMLTSPWEPPSPAGRYARSDRELQRLERRVWELAWGTAGYGETNTEGPDHVTTLPSPRCAPAGVHSDWVLKLGLQQTDPRRGLGLVARRQTKGSGVWSGPLLGVCACGGEAESWTDSWPSHCGCWDAGSCSGGLFTGTAHVCLRAPWADCLRAQGMQLQWVYVPVAWWARMLWTYYQGPQEEVGPKGSASNTDLCGCTHRVAGGITESHVLAGSSWGGTCNGSSPRGSAPVLPTSHHSLEPDLGISTTTTGEQTLPLTGLWHPQSKEEALPNIQCGLWSPWH